MARAKRIRRAVQTLRLSVSADNAEALDGWAEEKLEAAMDRLEELKEKLARCRDDIKMLKLLRGKISGPLKRIICSVCGGNGVLTTYVEEGSVDRKQCWSCGGSGREKLIDKLIKQ